jgi:hypothetical protein
VYFHLVNVADPRLRLFFPAPSSYDVVSNLPRSYMAQQVLGGDRVVQAFPLDETSRVIKLDGTASADVVARLEALDLAPGTALEFSDGSRLWTVVAVTFTTKPLRRSFRAGLANVRSGVYTYSMELGVTGVLV